MSFDADARFAQALLDSARTDALPDDVPQAWERFAAVLASAVPRAASAQSPSPDEGPSAETAANFVRAKQVAAGKWLLVGVLAGATPAVSLLLGYHLANRATSQPVLAGNGGPPPPSLGNAPSGTLTPPTSVAADPAPTPDTPAATSVARRPRKAPHAPRPQQEEDATLSEEVSRLDLARRAVAQGNHAEALRLIARYRYDFPGGVLAPDADVIAIEAVAAARDQGEVERRARLFLARYPHDPQVARVRKLAGNVRADNQR